MSFIGIPLAEMRFSATKTLWMEIFIFTTEPYGGKWLQKISCVNPSTQHRRVYRINGCHETIDREIKQFPNEIWSIPIRIMKFIKCVQYTRTAFSFVMSNRDLNSLCPNSIKFLKTKETNKFLCHIEKRK